MFSLRSLPYDTAAFGDFLSPETFEYHHGKHLAGYVANLNKLIAGSEFEKSDLISIIRSSTGPVFNNAAQIYNHDFYFDCLSPAKNKIDEKNPKIAELKKAIEADFGSFENFKEAFIAGATGLFGAGWFWLVFDPAAKKLKLAPTTNAATPITEGCVPLLVIDVWEHAYYVDHRNSRPAYVEGFFAHINWPFVAAAYEWAVKEGEGSVSFYANELHPVG